MTEILRPGEYDQRCIRALVEHYEARLESLRRQNDALTLGERRTTEKRARIAEIKLLLAVLDPATHKEHTAPMPE